MNSIAFPPRRTKRSERGTILRYGSGDPLQGHTGREQLKTLHFMALALLLAGSFAHGEHHESSETRTAIGMQQFEDGSSKPLFAGDVANIEIWTEYLQAHNDRDFEKIAAMNSDDFRGIAPTGETISGSAAQKEFLAAWIEASNPKWRVYWVIANDGENADGVMEEWLATGSIVTSKAADGSELTEYHTIDVLLENGKIKMVNAAAQKMFRE